MITAIDGQNCEKAFIKSGQDIEWLVAFLKKYPVGFRLSWVKNYLAILYEKGAWDELEALKPGRGQRRSEPPLKKIFVDYLLFERITSLLMQGYTLTGEGGAIRQVAETGIEVGAETLRLGSNQIKDRYYRFKKHEPARFMDDEKLLVGPTKVEIEVNGETITLIGFWDYEPPPD